MTILAIDAGTTDINAALITPDQGVLYPLSAARPDGDGEAVIQHVVIPMCVEILKQALANNIVVDGVGVGVAAHVNGHGIIHSAPYMPGWTGTSVATLLQDALTLPVIVDRDVHLMALAEQVLGAARGYDTVLYINIGARIASTLMRNGDIWRGSHGLADGMGAMVADWKGEKPITLEDIAAVPGIEWMFQSRSPNVERISFATIVRLAKEGKPLAVKVLRDSGRVFAMVVASVIAQIDPDIVVIGGSVAETEALWWRSFESTLRESSLAAVHEVTLAQAQVEVHNVLRGAAVLARMHLNSEP